MIKTLLSPQRDLTLFEPEHACLSHMKLYFIYDGLRKAPSEGWRRKARGVKEGAGALRSVKRSDFVPVVERRYLVPFALVTILFFAWALAAGFNDVLVRQFQKALDLTRTQSSFVQFAFYLGYFVAAIPAGMLIRRLGYKRVILIGLGLYAAGCFLFVPAASLQRYSVFLTALFMIAFGLACLETTANPYIAILGAPRTGASRLNLAQGFNGLGAVLGPLIGGLSIFSGIEHSKAELARFSAGALAAYRAGEAANVRLPYFILGLCVCLLALLIAQTRFPAIERPLAERATHRPFFSVLRHRRLRWAVVAEFFYVGVQVGIWSFFIDFAKAEAPALPERTAALLLSSSIALLMIGRFVGAYAQRFVAPERMLGLFAIVNVGLCLLAGLASGSFAVGALWLTSFFMSIMFPTIFTLGIAGLGEETENGASFLIMAIIGGALFPPAMGFASDLIGGIHRVMAGPALGFAVIAAFAIVVRRMDVA
jgi:MFS transporter, FHS family, L-fucose permease